MTRNAPREDIVGAVFVHENRGEAGVAIIDTRDTEFFDGTREGGPAVLFAARTLGCRVLLYDGVKSPC